MAKPRLYYYNKPNISEGLGVRAVEAKGVKEETGTGGDEGEGKERATHETPSTPALPAAVRERAKRPEGRSIRLKTEERRQIRIPRGQKLEEEGT